MAGMTSEVPIGAPSELYASLSSIIASSWKRENGFRGSTRGYSTVVARDMFAAWACSSLRHPIFLVTGSCMLLDLVAIRIFASRFLANYFGAYLTSALKFSK